MALIDYLLKWDESRGVAKLVIMTQLREYCNTADLIGLLEEIGSIWNEKHLDVLIAVGMRGALYYKVISQKAKILGI